MKTDKKNTRDLIFEAAVKLFSTKGFHGTSMRDLAKEVGIKESSLYNHYTGKNAILDTILDYQINGLKKAMFSREEMENKAAGYSDPVELWVSGTMEFRKRLPPLSESITKILLNEMFLNERCREFVLVSMFTTQKKMTEILLADLRDREMINECDIQQISVQYVYMMYGLNIENRLLEMEGRSKETVQKNMVEQITLFIERLKK